MSQNEWNEGLSILGVVLELLLVKSDKNKTN